MGTPGPNPNDVLVVRGVGEKRSAAQWALLVGVPALLLIVGVAIGITLFGAKPPQGDAQVRAPQPPTAQVSATDQPAQLPTTPPASSTMTPAGTAPATSTVPVSQPVRSTPTPAPRAAAGGGGVSGSGVWVAFRGADRMNVIQGAGLSKSFSQPKVVWQANMGEGHAGAAVYRGRVYVLDYDQGARKDVLRCLDLKSGKQLWSQGYSADVKRNHGMSRTVPATDGKYVVTLGPLGHVMCCEANSGKVVWRKNLVAEYGTQIPTWYAGQCPLIENNNVILAPGGKTLMMAVHLPTGNVTWATPNSPNWQMTHSSIMPVSFAGKRIYVYPASGGVVGVNARDGKLLWQTNQWTVSTANIPTPVPIGEGRIFVCGGYNSGAAILQMGSDGTSVSMVKRIPASVFQSHQQTPILYGGYLYGVKAPSGELVCLDLNGNIKWSSGNTARFGLGPYFIADGTLYVLSDKGLLVSCEASPSGYKPLSQAQVLNGQDAWAPMAVADGKVICRDLTRMVCLDL